MGSDIAILTSQKPNDADVNLMKLVNFCGVDCRIINLSPYDDLFDYLQKHTSNSDLSLMINSEFWASILPNRRYSDNLRSFLFSRASNIILYNLFPQNLQNSVIEHLSHGVFRSVRKLQKSSYEYQITHEFKDISKQFSGLSFGPINRDADFFISIENRSYHVTNIISINKLPFFVRLKKHNCNLFILANNRVLDIDAKIPESFNLKKCFSQFIPLMMFIKFVCKNRCWHSKQAYASFIIDDPLLRRTYGFLNYEKLLRIMDQYSFFANIAFIPWNHKRTREEVAKLFIQRPDRFMLCVHGCDHTNNEFEINDFDQLNTKVKLATQRMKDHEKSTGIKFDKVLVFPQGKFSSNAMKALKCNNYYGVVNSSFMSIDRTDVLKISDFLNIAIMDYYRFPLFVRRYPGELINFAFDLFMGKPALIVEHHDCFRDGYRKIVDLIRSISCLDENIHWEGLGNIIKKSYLEKNSLNGKNYIRMYSNRCEIANASNNHNVYTVSKEECGNVPVATVMVDGKAVLYKLEGRVLTLDIEIPPKRTVSLEIIYKDISAPLTIRKGFKGNFKVRVRRHLSEFRDNYISRNEVLLLIAYKLLKKL